MYFILIEAAMEFLLCVRRDFLMIGDRIIKVIKRPRVHRGKATPVTLYYLGYDTQSDRLVWRKIYGTTV